MCLYFLRQSSRDRIGLFAQVGGEELYSLHKSLKTLGQETRNLEVELNEEQNRAATSRQILKHLEPDVQAVQGRKDLEAKVDEYTQCKHFRVRFLSPILPSNLRIFLIGQDYQEKASEHEKVAKAFDIVKKKVGEINQRLKPLQDQIKKSKTEFDKAQTAHKSKVKFLSKRFPVYPVFAVQRIDGIKD